ncbi:MAG: LssY C-terminal domain-containing protein [Bryobacterales bacterium]|nr:LssY C-terminal domain-containing protein [Bryobacteraceae bacterium]MDW8354467.1 LssY C-terminal domain-containing protein [Bryobacterales bacterium]
MAVGALVVAFAGTVSLLAVGTELQVRLLTPVSSRGTPAGQRVEAVVIAPVATPDGALAIPSGTVVGGCVRAARPYAPEQRAVLELDFFELSLPSGERRPLAAKVAEVDNARESVDEQGRIVGILESETLIAKMDRGLERLQGRFARLAGVLRTAKEAVFEPPDADIVYEAGTELRLALTSPFPLERIFPPPALEAIEPAEDLLELVNAQPLQTTAASSAKPSDVTNLMFLGRREQIEAAFREAGWSPADPLDARSGLETARAVLENRGYKQAPMSVLLLEGRKPDLEFQKQLNTFAKRHHLRIWKRPARFGEREVWVAAATHDIGIAFSPENRTFIHVIDSAIDRERGKVVIDLVFTGRVRGLALVERPAAPRQTQNATGDTIVTDGRMAVLLF